jgi:hypothetical protein
MKRMIKKNLIVSEFLFLLFCSFSLSWADSLVFSQIDFILGGKLYKDTEWGSVDFAFIGQEPIMYFNLAVNGSWQVQNIAVLSREGVGVVQTMTYYFDLGTERGTNVTDLNYDYAFTLDILETMPAGSKPASVRDGQIVLWSGTGSGGGPPKPQAAKPLTGGRVSSSQKHAHKNFPNQQAGPAECTPTAVSNSLHFLKEKHNLDIDDSEITIDKMKVAVGWNKGAPDHWYTTKTEYMRNNNLLITTKPVFAKDFDTLLKEIGDGQDVEIDESWYKKNKDTGKWEPKGHTMALVGISGPHPDGTYSIDIADDTCQSNPTNNLSKATTLKYNPNPPDGIPEIEERFGKVRFDYAVVECPKGPSEAWNIIPTWGTIDATPYTLLKWAAPSDPNGVIVGYNVYMDPNETLVAMRSGCAWTNLGQLETTFDPAVYMPLSYNTTYYWCVDTIVTNTAYMMNGRSDEDPVILGDNITLPGDVWHFTTAPEIVITEQPSYTTALPGETAVFTISVDSATAPSFEWFQSSDAANNTPGEDVSVSTGSDSSIISPVMTGDEGYYYCKVTNEGTEVVYSETAALGVLREVAHWDLNGNYYDNSGEGHDAEPAGTPLFVVGIIGDAVQIDPNNGWASAGTWDPAEYTGELSISLWARWDGANGDKQGLISKRNAWAVDKMMWQLEVAPDTGELRFMSTSDTVSSTPLPCGDWEHIAVTFDGETATLYRNGVSISSGAFEFDFKTDANLTIGAGQRDDMGTVSYTFNGALDEILIYNYALNRYDVADLYYFGSGESVCLDPPLYDFDGDCIINLTDLAMLASHWLDCGLYPVCP